MHLSDMVDSAKRAISPGRRSHSPKRGRKLKKWAGDESVYLTCECSPRQWDVRADHDKTMIRTVSSAARTKHPSNLV
jgi:hypothetical protein